ncbi:2-oxoacid:acceptor oxidoreductase subunit alpha [bacterium]|nr:2-oxoacid:acceptor oxidoreductase subunit alpha [bacterium]
MQDKGKPTLIQGNIACGYGALAAGCSFFAGYPITPSTEIAEFMARELPKRGGKFIQMEDEMGSLAAVIGASIAGAKAMTATSGPGFSLMQEHLGFAYMTETPVVVVNVMRGGPSTGLPTMTSQSDTLQAGFGPHGDYCAVVFAPSSVQEVFEYTVKAFNAAEFLQTPVVLLMDETLAHMRERFVHPPADSIEVINRKEPEMPFAWFKRFEMTPDCISNFSAFGDGYRYHITGLTHDQMGFPTAVSREVTDGLEKLRDKILNHKERFTYYEKFMTDDANWLIVAFGTAARSAKQAVIEARRHRMKVGLLQLCTIWPFPDELIAELSRNIEGIVVAEMNMGQLIREVKRACPRKLPILGANRYDGVLITPDEIIHSLKVVHGNKER